MMFYSNAYVRRFEHLFKELLGDPFFIPSAEFDHNRDSDRSQMELKLPSDEYYETFIRELIERFQQESFPFEIKLVNQETVRFDIEKGGEGFKVLLRLSISPGSIHLAMKAMMRHSEGEVVKQNQYKISTHGIDPHQFIDQLLHRMRVFEGI